MAITAEKEYPIPEPDDDLKRELAFYTQALDAVSEGKVQVKKAGVVFTRPDDYFAEMVKSDDHMQRIRRELMKESLAIKASEDAKRQRELKKIGKKVQVEKIRERQQQKTKALEQINQLKRKRQNMPTADDDDGSGAYDDLFDVDVDDNADDTPIKQSMKGKRADSKSKLSRTQRNKKYGFGGPKRNSRSNTFESTNEMREKPKSRIIGKKSKRLGKSRRHQKS
ncbi:RRNA processing protein [Dimargaris xerosporica]|nr:RRNA processing protein [Dimargaris xerosporica]